MSPRSKSGRVVIDVDPELKRNLYSVLTLADHSLKDWFVREASSLCEYAIKYPERPIQDYFSFYRNPESRVIASPMISDVFSSKNAVRVVSMFSGCGGMDLGFTGGFDFLGKNYKRLPFEIIWANDLNSVACKTYERNLGHEIRCGSVWDEIDTLPKSTDVLIGGFPCQDISINGKRKGVEGARSGLYRAMVEGIRMTKPKIFVAENVKGLLMGFNQASLQQVLSDFRSLGYTVRYHLFLAADYGVPQMRERVIFVGTRTDVKPFVFPSKQSVRWVTASEALQDLEKKAEDKDFSHIWSRANVSSEQGNRHLKPDKPAHTIRAECHGNIQYHYKLPRRISMREAARIQSFPDTFCFAGGLRDIERQIGNAVPPVLAWHIANAILDCVSQ